MSPARASSIQPAGGRAAVAITAVLAGCSLTGLGGSDQYGCKAPEGVRCESVSGNYANAVQDNLPAQRRSSSTRSASIDAGGRTAAQTPVGGGGPVKAAETPDVPGPLRSEPRILRLWFKAYLDSDQDLNDQGYVFVQIDGGRWLIERTQHQAREAFAPVRPPRSTASASPSDAARSTSARSTASPDSLRPVTALPAAPNAAVRAKPRERP